MQTEQTQNATPKTLDMEALVTRYLDTLSARLERLEERKRWEAIEEGPSIHKTPDYWRLAKKIEDIEVTAEKVDTLFGDYLKAQRLHEATAKNLEQVEYLLRELIGQPAE